MFMDGFSDSGRNMQKLQSSSVQRPPSYFDLPFLNAPQMGAQMRPSLLNLSPDNVGKRPGMPPPHPNNPATSPYSQIVGSRPNSPLPASQNSKHGPSHCRSLSQPSFFSLDSLPPLSPSPYREASVPSPSEATSADVPMEDRSANLGVRRNATAMGGGNEFGVGESLPPRKGHRRSCSDISMGFSAMFQSSPQLMSVGSRGAMDRSGYGKESPAMEKPIQLVKRESESSKDGHGNAEGMGERKSEGEVADDLFNAYMNLDNIDTLNSSGTDDKDLDSRASGTKTNGVESSDNEVESGVNGYPVGMQGTSSHISNDKREGLKRGATGDIAPTARHYRSVSMDSYMGTLQFDDESIKLPLGNHAGQLSPGNSADGKSSKFNLEFGNGEFTPAEMKKIMENDKLAEMASVDPKRVKRILANRQSAARSKERKMRYIAELEHKVQTLQTEATTLSAQLTMLQRDSAGLTNQNNELKFRLQAMEQQAQLKDALNEALAAEVQRLKLAAAELSGEAHLSNCMAQQLTINPQMFQLQSRQPGGYQLPEQGSQPSQLESQKAQAGDQSQIQQQKSEHPADELKS